MPERRSKGTKSKKKRILSQVERERVCERQRQRKQSEDKLCCETKQSVTKTEKGAKAEGIIRCFTVQTWKMLSVGFGCNDCLIM